MGSLGINESEKFCQTKLGLDKTGYMVANYALIDWNDFVVHFQKFDLPIYPKNISCYVDAKKIEEFYKEFLRFNVIHPNGFLEDKAYG